MNLGRFVATSCSLAISALLAPPFPTSATAGPPEILGTASQGRPFVVRDDVLVERLDTYNLLRDFAGSAASPEFLGQFDNLSGVTWTQVLVEDDLMVLMNEVVANMPGWTAVDIGDPRRPQVVAMSSGGSYDEARLRDRRLLVARDALFIVQDLTEPADALLQQAFVVGARDGERGFSDVGDFTFALDGASSIRRFDVRDPENYVDQGIAWSTDVRIDHMVAAGGALHLVVDDPLRADATLVTLDVGTAGELSEVSRVERIDVGPARRTLHADGTLLLFLDGRGDVVSFDLDAAGRPVRGRTLRSDVEWIAITRSWIVLRRPGGTRFVPRDVRPRFGPIFEEFANVGPFIEVAGRGTHPLVLDLEERRWVRPVDLSNPTRPRVGAPLDLGKPGILVADELLAAHVPINAVRIQLIDRSEPAAPRMAASLEPDVALLGSVVLSDEWLAATVAVALDPATLQTLVEVFDVRDPDRPESIGRLPYPTPVAIEGDLVLVNELEALVLIDLGDSSAPREVVRLDLPPGRLGIERKAVLQDGLIYLMSLDPGVGLDLTIHDPGRPHGETLRGRLPLQSSIGRLFVDGTRLYLQRTRVIDVFDVSDPTAPRLLAVVDVPAQQAANGLGFANGVVLAGGNMFTLSARESRVPTSVSSHAPSIALSAPAPNPFNPRTTFSFTLARPSDTRVVIHDARGRRVDQLWNGPLGAGDHTFTWDGRDVNARRVASGVYFVKVRGGSFEARTRVTLVE